MAATDKENERPTADTTSIIPCDIDKHEESNELMIQDVEALLDLGPKLVSQLSNWANDMRNRCFSPVEVVEILDKAGKMMNRYFVTLAIVNCYWNLLLRNTADLLKAMNISYPVKTSMHELRMSAGMQDWLFQIKTKQDWLD